MVRPSEDEEHPEGQGSKEVEERPGAPNMFFTACDQSPNAIARPHATSASSTLGRTLWRKAFLLMWWGLHVWHSSRLIYYNHLRILLYCDSHPTMVIIIYAIQLYLFKFGIGGRWAQLWVLPGMAIGLRFRFAMELGTEGWVDFTIYHVREKSRRAYLLSSWNTWNSRVQFHCQNINSESQKLNRCFVKI